MLSRTGGLLVLPLVLLMASSVQGLPKDPFDFPTITAQPPGGKIRLAEETCQKAMQPDPTCASGYWQYEACTSADGTVTEKHGHCAQAAPAKGN